MTETEGGISIGESDVQFWNPRSVLKWLVAMKWTGVSPDLFDRSWNLDPEKLNPKFKAINVADTSVWDKGNIVTKATW
jgi:hypothetical protein